MDKKKKITIGIVIAVLILLVVLFLVFNKKSGNNGDKSNSNETSNVEEVTIKFDSAGGADVNEIKVKKSGTIILPTTTREGYNFVGWFDGEEQVSNDTKFDSNKTLLAHWEEIPKDAKTFTIKFDSKGGSEVSDLVAECDKGLRLPSTKPTKEGYTFVSWADKNGKVILDGARLSCEDLTLYANWEKAETKKEYKCSEGTLDGNKCVSSVDAKEKCPDKAYNADGKCVTLTNSVRKDTQKACPKEHVTYKSFAGEVDGKVVNWGVIGCAYYKTNDTAKSECESHGFKWVTPENACYVKWVSNNTINDCNHLDGYAYITNPNQYDGVNGLNGGCFPIVEKTKYCDKEGYTLSGSKCIKIVEAELK